MTKLPVITTGPPPSRTNSHSSISSGNSLTHRRHHQEHRLTALHLS